MTEGERLVRLWMQAATNNRDAEWVAKMLGTTRKRVIHRASYFRRRGVRLPHLVAYSAPSSVASLNKIVDSYGK